MIKWTQYVRMRHILFEFNHTTFRFNRYYEGENNFHTNNTILEISRHLWLEQAKLKYFE